MFDSQNGNKTTWVSQEITDLILIYLTFPGGFKDPPAFRPKMYDFNVLYLIIRYFVSDYEKIVQGI